MWQGVPRLVGKDNLWARLSEDLDNPQPFDAQAGLWGQIVMGPAGLWRDLRDETLILEQRIISVWDDVEDETLIVRPRFNIWERAVPAPRPPSSEPQPHAPNLWDEVADETLPLGRIDLTMWVMPTVRSMATYRPQRAHGWALKKLETATGEDYYVLKNMRNGTYLRLNEHQEYLWHLLDGSYTLQDLAVASFMRFGTFNVEWLSNYLAQLKFKGFLIEADQDVYAATQADAERRTLRYWLKRAVKLVFQSEFNLPVERFYARIYRAAGWVLFTRVAQILILLITLAGIPAYYLATQASGVSLLQGSSAVVGIGLIGLIAAQTIIFFVHESMHALTTKHYGRQVRRGGVGLYFGMIAFFIDTTDIWMEPRGPRLRVTWAGPYSGFFLGSVASLLLLIAPQAVWTGFAYQLATLAFWVSLINLNPLLKLDGYYILMDWLEMPMLRERSIDFVRHKLIGKLAKREAFTRDDKIYAVFGILSLLFSAIMIVLLIRLYGLRLVNFVLSLF